MSIEEIAAKGVLGLQEQAPSSKLAIIDPVDAMDPVVDVVPLLGSDEEEDAVPISTDEAGDLISDGMIVINEPVVETVSVQTVSSNNDFTNSEGTNVNVAIAAGDVSGQDARTPGSVVIKVGSSSSLSHQKAHEAPAEEDHGFFHVTEAVVETVPVPAAPVEEIVAPKKEIAQIPEGTVAGSGSTEKENVIWPDDATHDYIARPREFDPFDDIAEEAEGEEEANGDTGKSALAADADADTETGTSMCGPTVSYAKQGIRKTKDCASSKFASSAENLCPRPLWGAPTKTNTNEFLRVWDVCCDQCADYRTDEPIAPTRTKAKTETKQEEQFDTSRPPVIVLDAPNAPPSTTAATATTTANDTYEYVTAEEYAQEFSIVLEKCGQEGYASNSRNSADADDFTTNPCVRSEPTFVGCTDANLFSASINPFDDAVVKTTVAFNYDLYLRSDAEVQDAVEQLEETMLYHVAGGMKFDQCGDSSAADGGRRLFAEEVEEKEGQPEKNSISLVGLSSQPIDVRDATYQQCTSNLPINDEVETKCVPMRGKMTLYLSSKDDRFAAKHIVKTMVKSGAADGSFLSSGAGDDDILGVAYVENRALDAARMPGNNLGQFKANAGVSGLAIGLVSFLGLFVGCAAFGHIGMRRNKRSKGGDDDSIINEEAENAELVKGDDGSFPTFPQLAKITPSDDTEDLENPTSSSELLNVGSADFGVSADDTTVEAANTKEAEAEADIIHSIPLPSNKDLASVILAEEAGNDEIPPIRTTGSTEFGTPAVLSPPSAPSKTDDNTWMLNGAEKRESWEDRDQDELPSTTTSELSADL